MYKFESENSLWYFDCYLKKLLTPAIVSNFKFFANKKFISVMSLVLLFSYYIRKMNLSKAY